jgi:5-methyltetrahydrofolate--homocysteine methyltransferase
MAIETNTFSATKISMADYGCEHLVQQLNLIRQSSRAPAVTPLKPKMASGALSRAQSGQRIRHCLYHQTSTIPAIARSIDYLKGVYREQCDAPPIEGGVDFLLIETIFDTLKRQMRSDGGAGSRTGIGPGRAL